MQKLLKMSEAMLEDSKREKELLSFNETVSRLKLKVGAIASYGVQSLFTDVLLVDEIIDVIADNVVRGAICD